MKDQPKADYSAMIQSIKAEGLKEPVILRQREDGEYQLVDGFHRMQAIKKAGMLEVRADVYDMSSISRCPTPVKAPFLASMSSS